MNSKLLRVKVEDALDKYLSEQIALADSSLTKTLLKRLKEVILAGGKRFRPLLFYETYLAYGGKLNVISTSMALEILHQSLLIHDDLIDEDLHRHGSLNITGQYLKDKNIRPNKTAESMGLLAGDYLLSQISRIISRDRNLSDKQKLDQIEVLAQAFSSAVYGQQLDCLVLTKPTKLPTTKTLVSIYELKTAAYSTIAPMRMATSLLKLSAKELTKIDDFAQSLGIYFQLVNDHSDYFSRGKAVASLKDFSCGKVTYAYLVSLKLAKKSDANFLMTKFAIEGLKLSDKRKIVNIMESCGARSASEDFINRYKQEALNGLAKLSINEISKGNLLALVDSLKV